MSDRYRLTSIELDEVSLVDVPANKSARVAIWKKQQKETPMDRKDMEKEMTAEERARFAEMIDKEGMKPEDAYERMKAKDMKKSDAEVLAARLEAENAALRKALDDAGVKVVREGDVLKVALPETAAEDVVMIGGEPVAKSAVPAPVLKALETQARELAALQKAAERATFAKRAEDEWPSLKGAAEVKGALLKTVEGLPEAEAAALKETLKAADEAMKALFSQRSSVELDETSPMARLNKMAADHAKANGVPIETAHAEVLKTADGRALWAESRASKH